MIIATISVLAKCEKILSGTKARLVKIYDIKPLFERLPVLGYFKEHEDEFFGGGLTLVATGLFGMTTLIYRVMNFRKMEFRLRLHLMV